MQVSVRTSLTAVSLCPMKRCCGSSEGCCEQPLLLPLQLTHVSGRDEQLQVPQESVVSIFLLPAAYPGGMLEMKTPITLFKLLVQVFFFFFGVLVC